MTSWTGSRPVFKSPLRTVVGFICRSRDLKADKCRSLRKELENANRSFVKCQSELERESAKFAQLQPSSRTGRRETRGSALFASRSSRGVTWLWGSDGLLVGCSSTGGRISRCRTGTENCFEWLGVEVKLPSFTTIRHWFQRVGLATVKEPLEKADDWVWLADHSNQIGPEKVLSVLAIRGSQLPEMGTTMQHEDVHVLTVQPGTNWKKEERGKRL